MQLEFQILALENPKTDIWQQTDLKTKTAAIEVLARLIAKAAVNNENKKGKESDYDGNLQD